MTAAAVSAPPSRIDVLSAESLRVAGIIVAWKLGVFAVIVIAAHLFSFEAQTYIGNYHYPTGDRAVDFASHLKTWDASHYLHLAKDGYAVGDVSNGFFPLFPLSIRVVERLGIPAVTSGLLVANGASFAAAYLLYFFTKRLTNARVALGALLLLLAFPTAFFLTLIYSEGLFLLLLVAFFLTLYNRSYGIAALAAFLLPWVRLVGLVCLLPFAYTLFERRHEGVEDGGSAHYGDFVYLLAPLLGLAAYFVYMHATTGDAFASNVAQAQYVDKKDWHNVYQPWVMARLFFASNLRIGTSAYFTHSLLDRVFFVGFLASIPFVYLKVDKALFVTFLCLGFVTLFGSFMSYMRYLMVAFPLYIAGASWLQHRSWLVWGGILAPMLALQVAFITMHSLAYWVG